MKKRVLLIVGPTAIGKTTVSLELAKRIDCEIISADSRQVYKYMDVGTAKPSKEERATVPHHFIDIKFPDEYYSAGQFGSEARKCADAIIARGKQPVVVGGSGLYIRGLVDGFFEPKISNGQVKANLKKQAQENGISSLYQRLKLVDLQTAEKLHPADSQRIMRALEVFEITGQPFSQFLKIEPRSATFEPCFIGLAMERADLYDRIDRRVDAMIANGLLEEVEELRNRGYGPHLNALRTVGYKQAFMYLENKLSYSEMADLIKQKTRNYAKRQLTWFRKEKRIHWIDVNDFKKEAELAGHIQKIFHKEETLRANLT